MSPFFLRVLLAADANQQIRFWEQGLRDAGQEVVAVAPQGNATLRAARLVHSDVVVVGTPLLSDPGGHTLAATLRPNAILVVQVTEPAELIDLLAQKMARRAAELWND
jgi:AmiR/NasT family two-component response regulator